MFYEIRINGTALAVVGHPDVANMSLSLSISDDLGPPDVCASAVCREAGALYFYDWLQHPVAHGDKVEFALVEGRTSMAPLNRYQMKRGAMLQALHPVLSTQDVPASIAFFRDLGFALLFQDSVDSPKYAGVSRDRIELHLQWADATQWAHPGDRPAYRFLVRDVDALYAEFSRSGRIHTGTSDGSPWAAPADTPWGTREFHLRDPGRNSLQFYRPR